MPGPVLYSDALSDAKALVISQRDKDSMGYSPFFFAEVESILERHDDVVGYLGLVLEALTDIAAVCARFASVPVGWTFEQTVARATDAQIVYAEQIEAGASPDEASEATHRRFPEWFPGE